MCKGSPRHESAPVEVDGVTTPRWVRITRRRYVQLLVSECSAMRALELRGNPLCRSSKYRNDIIIHGENLQQVRTPALHAACLTIAHLIESSLTPHDDSPSAAAANAVATWHR